MDCEKGMENHSGVDGDFASHKSTAICWSYQKAKGITKKRAAPVKRCCPFLFAQWYIVLLGIFFLPSWNNLLPVAPSNEA